MKESETVKEYADKLLSIVNRAEEQRRLVRQEGSIEGALPVKLQLDQNNRGKKKKGKKKNGNQNETAAKNNSSSSGNNNRNHPHCQSDKKELPP